MKLHQNNKKPIVQPSTSIMTSEIIKGLVIEIGIQILDELKVDIDDVFVSIIDCPEGKHLQIMIMGYKEYYGFPLWQLLAIKLGRKKPGTLFVDAFKVSKYIKINS